MHYIIEYEACALIFLVIITMKFFEVRQFPNKLNRLFGVILYCAVLDLVLDIVGALTIEYANLVPVWVNYGINTVFYSIQILFPLLLTVYVLIMVGRFIPGKPSSFFIVLPAALFELILLINLFTGSIFYIPRVDGILVYTRGPLFDTLFICPAIYLVFTFAVAVRFRQKMRAAEFSTIISFILSTVAATVLQFIYPQILLTGVAITIAIETMYFTMQNPESMLDLISGVFNYTALIAHLRNQIIERRPMWIIAIDVGGIRRINSTLGINAGNEILAQTGSFLYEECGSSVISFRMISTRFVIIASDERDCERLLPAIEYRFSQPWSVCGIDFPLTATICHFGRQNHFDSTEDVINLIDTAYSKISADGIGSTVVIGPEMLQTANRLLDVETAMREALESGTGFSLNYQPLFCPSTGNFISAEALLRLDTPGLGRISPAEFIPIAEKNGLIFKIDQLVVKMACDFLHRHPDLTDIGVRFIEINLSAAEFYRDTRGLIDSIISFPGCKPSMICFEVTETAASTHQDVLADFMTTMIGHGFSFALDDFGTGYANLTQITSLPFKIVKLDRSLLTSDGGKERQIFDGLVKLFYRIGLETVVEGVETLEQANRVSELGTSQIQGFYYSKPLPEKEFLEFITSAAKNQT